MSQLLRTRPVLLSMPFAFVALLIITIVFSVPDKIGAQSECKLPGGLQPISQCVDGSGNVTIGPSAGTPCTHVFFDGSRTGTNALKKVTIESGGTLYIGDEDINIEVETIEVNGLLQAGTQDCPIGHNDPSHQVTMTFTGERPCPSPDHCDGFNKGIQVNAGGTLRLFGIKGVPESESQGMGETGISWTHLSAPAGPLDRYGADSGALAPVTESANSIHVNEDVTRGPGAWRAGDWIAIGTTSFSSVETEIVQIQSLSVSSLGGTEITLEQNLKHYHFGGPDPGLPSSSPTNLCSGFNYGVDERAEVGLLSRNIKLTADIPAGDNNLHWGGELQFLKDFKEVSLQGVQIEKFGKDKLASYPIHFHMDGDVSGQAPLVNGNSIHHSYNKCVTIHSTQNMTVENNVCVRIVSHIFYQEIGDEEGIRYLNNLGLGAMSNNFDVEASSDTEREQKIKDYWWSGDMLGQTDSPHYNGYDGFNIPATDAQDNPVRGACSTRDPSGRGLILGQNPYTPGHPGECSGNEIYFEPAGGFWIIHPGTELIGNSIGGCQGVGRGYWYVPARNDPAAGVPENLTQLSLQPVGTFKDNRVHSCYSGLYAEGEFNVFAEQLFPREGGTNTGKNIIATFDGLTATRNRDRGVWMRPVWLVVKNSRFATNRNSVTLVSSGGLDGNAPGVWALLEKSVLVGVSQNNVDRWGPCPQSDLGESYECVGPRKPLMSDPNSAKGFPGPAFNFSGYMIYDGPVRIFDNRFVNFNVDITQHLTNADKTFLDSFVAYPNGNNPNVYEGDAALGWFQNNQSAYPTGTESRELRFENVDLRHQIYTEKVNLGDFQDGDKNTAIIDLDGTLTGFSVVDGSGNPVEGAHPISLNNLEFNHASNSVDECHAEGAQDAAAEGRPTSLISAGSYATLEFQAMFPPPLPEKAENTKQTMTFLKDQQDFGEHSEMELTSRNGLGVWEPKVASGYGYTVGASTCDLKPICSDDSGIPARVSVGLTDAVKPEISEDDPFYVRIGICYTNKDGTHPADTFTIKRGYRSWGGNGSNTQDRDLQQYFNELLNRYQGQTCHNLDFQVAANREATTGCPANGVTPLPNGGCPPPSVPGKDVNNLDSCIYPTDDLTAAASIDGLTLADGSPDLTKYFYDAARGLLFFYVAQTLPNAFGPSPLGSCSESGSGDDPTCPDTADGESYYACPAAGCADYVVELDDATYDPGPSNCDPYPTYAQDPPGDQLMLAHIGSGDIVTQVEAGGKDGNFPHFEAETAPDCPENTFESSSFVLAQANADDTLICPPSLTVDGGGCSLMTKDFARVHQSWLSLSLLTLLVLQFMRLRRQYVRSRRR